MIYRRFGVKVTLLVLLLAATIFAFSFTVFQSNLKVTSFNLLALSVLELWFLIYTVKRTNRNLARFFVSFQNKDSSITFEGNKLGSEFAELHGSMNQLLKQYSELQQEREAQYTFFNSIIQQIPIGIMIFNKEGYVLLHNKALLQLLNMAPFKQFNSLDTNKPGLSNLILELKSSQSEVIKISKGQLMMSLSIRVSEFIVRNEPLKLVIFQDVTSELEQAEIESMQKMVRVLTHEIMNSVSPITISSASLIRQLEENDVTKNSFFGDSDAFKDAQAALNAIHKRSKGLTNFVENYRKFTRLPEPVFEMLEIKKMVNTMEALFRNQFSELNVLFFKEVVPENLTLLADEKLLEQVLVNLIKNSLEALEPRNNSYIKLTAVKFGEQVIIQVEDNGKGISPEIFEQIFTPMFTTKPNGTGIGLSLSRQIIHLHRGSIQVKSDMGVKTVFTLRF
jgi:two-component system, NtrC family, nitrogen regulation sensor histidine kinase NtrY